MSLVTLHWRALGDALRRLGRRPLATLLALLPATAALTLVLVAASLALLLQPQWQRLSAAAPALALVAVGSSAADLAALQRQAQALPGVAAVEVIARDAALADLARRHPDLLPPLHGNPLPDALLLRFDRGQPVATAAAAVTALRKLPGIDAVQFDEHLHRRWYNLLRFSTGAAIAVAGGLLLLALSALLLAPRALMPAPPSERRLLALLGADPGFGRRPYLYAGALLGLLAAGLAVAALATGAALAAPWLQALGLEPAATPARLLPDWTWLAGTAGIAALVGAVGGAWAGQAAAVRPEDPPF